MQLWADGYRMANSKGNTLENRAWGNLLRQSLQQSWTELYVMGSSFIKKVYLFSLKQYMII